MDIRFYGYKSSRADEYVSIENKNQIKIIRKFNILSKYIMGVRASTNIVKYFSFSQDKIYQTIYNVD